MTELVVGKHEFYPYECSKCNGPTLQDLEELLRSLKDEKRETVGTIARQPRRREHDVPPSADLGLNNLMD